MQGKCIRIRCKLLFLLMQLSSFLLSHRTVYSSVGARGLLLNLHNLLGNSFTFNVIFKSRYWHIKCFESRRDPWVIAFHPESLNFICNSKRSYFLALAL